MPAERFFIDTLMENGQKIEVSGEEFSHLKVMRVDIGDTLELINGRHLLAHASVEKIEKHAALLNITQIEERAPLIPTLTLCIALPRFNHLEWIAEKATELGASALWLFPGDRSEKTNVSEQQLFRLRNLMIAAIKQCGRLDLPVIEIHPALHAWHYPPKGSLFFGDVSPSAPLLAHHLPPSDTPIFFFTGPEKGFSIKEQLLLENAWHARGVSLHPYTLRTETAPILATGLIRHLLMK